MGGAWRRIALATMLVAVGLLVLTLATRGSTDDGASTSTDAGSGGGPVATATAVPPSTATPNPFAVSAGDDSLTVERLWSPLPNTARAEGTIAGDQRNVVVTTDGQPLPTITIIGDASGAFVVDITGLSPGPQQLCLADACQRVLVADPATEPRPVIDARINEALLLVEARLDLQALLPGWTIAVGGPNSSVGGSTNAAETTMTINANSGRTLADYEITILHEVAHGIDAVWMTPTSRDEFRSLRGHGAGLAWSPVEQFAVGDDRWNNSAEDFAEVFVAWALDNNYSIMSTVVASQPNDDDLRTFCTLMDADPITCE